MRKIALCCMALGSTALLAASQAPQSKIDDDGTLHIEGESLPYSDLASPEARRNFVEYRREWFERLPVEMKDAKTVPEQREAIDRLVMTPGLARLRKTFAVQITPTLINGVQTDVVVPAGGISAANANRVLINLHGGSFQIGARLGGQVESVPIASMGAIKVITVDYRMAPESQFPAGSEDVAKVYADLLKTYRPENIGIYGCSAGGALTAQSVAWFQARGLPTPGAIGLFGFGAVIGPVGDGNYLFTGGKPYFPPDAVVKNPYFKGADLNSPLVSPARDESVLRRFPPTLLISGTRDGGLSPVLYTHARLIDAGVEADLHVIEGAPHCVFAQPVIDPEVPEIRHVWRVTTRFFDQHLGRKPKST